MFNYVIILSLHLVSVLFGTSIPTSFFVLIISSTHLAIDEFACIHTVSLITCILNYSHNWSSFSGNTSSSVLAGQYFL